MDTPPEFVDTQAECAYWRTRAKDLKVELDEFTEDSNQLEKELEITIKLKDDQLTDLRHKDVRQQHEIDNLSAKLKQSENEALQWEQRYKKERTEMDKLKKYTRELEQKNDDLERAHRIVTESVAEFERMLNREYEKNVMLEVEYEMEKENNQTQLQRLMDEARDLKQELKMQQKQPGYMNPEMEKRMSAVGDGGGVGGSGGTTLATMVANESITENGVTSTSKSLKDMLNSNKEDTNTHYMNGLNNNNNSNNSNGTTPNDQLQPPMVPPAENGATTVTSQTTPGHSRKAVQRENSIKKGERLKNGNSAMTASSRSAALAIVADLLRRVNTIDAKLKDLNRPKSNDDDVGNNNNHNLNSTNNQQLLHNNTSIKDMSVVAPLGALSQISTTRGHGEGVVVASQNIGAGGDDNNQNRLLR